MAKKKRKKPPAVSSGRARAAALDVINGVLASQSAAAIAHGVSRQAVSQSMRQLRARAGSS